MKKTSSTSVSLTSEGATGATAPGNAILTGGKDSTGKLQPFESYTPSSIPLTAKGLVTSAVVCDLVGTTLAARYRYLSYNGSVNATGGGSTIGAANAACNNYTVQLGRTSGSDEITCTLQGSLDNTDYFDLSDSETSASGKLMFHVTNKVVQYLRLYVSAIGTSVYDVDIFGVP